MADGSSVGRAPESAEHTSVGGEAAPLTLRFTSGRSPLGSGALQLRSRALQQRFQRGPNIVQQFGLSELVGMNSVGLHEIREQRDVIQ
jgi:hypothetical protein